MIRKLGSSPSMAVASQQLFSGAGRPVLQHVSLSAFLMVPDATGEATRIAASSASKKLPTWRDLGGGVCGVRVFGAEAVPRTAFRAKKKNPRLVGHGFELVFWLPGLDSNQRPSG